MTFGPIPSLRRRAREPEVMEQPGLHREEHVKALRGLERLNRWSRSAAIVWPPISRLRATRRQGIRILDVASGGGDVPIALWQRAGKVGLPIEIHGWDKSSVAVEHARRQAAECDANVHFHEADVLTATFPDGFDVVVSSLFLHHLPESEAVQLLRRMKQAAARIVLVNDLVRCRPGYLLAMVASRLLTRSEVVHVDALRSVAAAFTVREARRLAREADLTGARVVARWPFRFLLCWKRP